MSDIRCLTNRTYGSTPRQAFDLFVPEAVDDFPTVLCLHGGWWSGGHREELRPFAMALAEEGFAAACVGTRLLGDGARHGHDLVDDVVTAAGKVLEESQVFGGNAKTLVLLGSGSGSLIALVAAEVLGRDPKLRVRAAVACGVTPTLEPWDGCPTAIARQLPLFAAHQGHLLNPLALKGDAFPPLLLLHGDNDLDVPAKLAQRLHARVVEAGESSSLAVLAGLGHQFIEHPYERGGRTALERIVPFLREHVREPESLELFARFAGQRTDPT